MDVEARIDAALASSGVADVLVMLKPELRGAARNNGPGVIQAGLKLAAGLMESAGAPAATELAAHFIASSLTPLGEELISTAEEIFDFGGAPAAMELASSLLRATTTVMSPGPVRFYPNLGVMLGTVNSVGRAALRSDQRVESVRPAPVLQLIHPTGVKAAHTIPLRTWGIDALNIPDLWNANYRGRGVRIGHLDTGVDGRHPALTEAIKEFADFDDFGMLRPAVAPFDSGEHGTHTAGTLVGRPMHGHQVGVAYEADLVSASVIEDGNVLARVLGGMDWIVGQGVHILNMSLGLAGWWDDFRDLTRLLRERNILPVFAIGNEGENTSRSPGNYPEALSVGAVDRHGRIAPFSSSQRSPVSADPTVGAVPAVVAPGVGILSCAPGGGFAESDGTSMAAPHIAGLAALLMQKQLEGSGRTDTAAVEAAILSSCSLNVLTTDRAGRGIPCARRCLARI